MDWLFRREIMHRLFIFMPKRMSHALGWAEYRLSI